MKGHYAGHVLRFTVCSQSFLPQAWISADEFLQKFCEWRKDTFTATAVVKEGACTSLSALSTCLDDMKEPLKNYGATLLEQLALKSTSFPQGEAAGMCGKLNQWVAGAKYGIGEVDIHPAILKYCRGEPQQ